MKKKEKNVIAYYASEENAYEIVRVIATCSDMLSRIRTTMTDDDGIDELEAKRNVESLKEGLENNGYAYVEYENAAEYNMLVGVAYHGKTKHITDMLKERRHEIISMF